MSPSRPSTEPGGGCDHFDEHADELALGQIDEPLRSRLLAHATGCPRCHALLAGLGTVVDRLLLVAPQVEPPAGFESRVLARMATASASAAQRRGVPFWVAAVVAAATAALAVGVTLLAGESSPGATPAAEIVAATGAEVGFVRLVADPEPHVLITVTAPRPGAGLRHCELQRDDGNWVEVGTWEVADLASGVWAVGIDADLLGATAMRVTDANGSVLATARFG